MLKGSSEQAALPVWRPRRIGLMRHHFPRVKCPPADRENSRSALRSDLIKPQERLDQGIPREALSKQSAPCGAWMRHHFQCVKRRENARSALRSDLIKPQERLDQGIPSSAGCAPAVSDRQRRVALAMRSSGPRQSSGGRSGSPVRGRNRIRAAARVPRGAQRLPQQL